MPTTARNTGHYSGDLIEHLRAFASLAGVIERGATVNAFSRAATELALDQSVLRRRLTTLQEHVGTPLFSGRGTALRLTAAGAQVRDQAAKMMELAASIGLRGEQADEGPLRIACTGTILAEVLPPVLGAIAAKHPKLKLRVRRAGDEPARALLAKGEIDFAIVRATNAPSASEGFEARRLTPDHLWLAMAAKTELAESKRVSVEAVARAPLIGYPAGSATMRRVMSVLGPLGASPWIEVDRKAAALAYVGAGLGVAFVSLVAGQVPERKNVVVRNVTTLFPRMSFWLLWSAREGTLASWRKEFADRLTAALRER